MGLGKKDYFATTRWSVVLSSRAASDATGQAHAALSELCRIYWRPVFAYVCHRGHQFSDAQDLTQDFLLHVLEGNILKRADPNRGRFRALLCSSLRNFLHDAHERKSAKKRGGGQHFVEWEEWVAGAPSQLSFAAETVEAWPAEKVFDLRWAATVVERSLGRLKEECDRRGRGRVFEVLQTFLTTDEAQLSYAQASVMLELPEATVKTLLHRMRLRFRALLREEVAETVEDGAEIDAELRYLCSVLSVVRS